MSVTTEVAAQAPLKSEDILSRKTDLCIANSIVKAGFGFGAGVLLSVVLFKRRTFPVWIGTGAGLGSAYTECNLLFNPAAIPGYRIADGPAVPAAASLSAPKA